MPFKVIDDKLLKNYNRIREFCNRSSLMGLKFDSEPVYGDNNKCVKTKIKLYGGKVNINFQGKKIPKENALSKCL